MSLSSECKKKVARRNAINEIRSYFGVLLVCGVAGILLQSYWVACGLSIAGLIFMIFTTGLRKEVDCAAHMPICKAVCCRLDIPLTKREARAELLKTLSTNALMVQKNVDGYCIYNEQPCGRCGVYRHRPKVCRWYSCANDSRIWTDFDEKILNGEWIELHLRSARPPE